MMLALSPGWSAIEGSDVLFRPGPFTAASTPAHMAESSVRSTMSPKPEKRLSSATESNSRPSCAARHRDW